MKGSSSLAETAALLADPTRAAVCLALLDGRAWTAIEVARQVGVAPSTASEQLSRLVAGGFLAEERQGRHRYLRLAGPEVAALIEDLSAFTDDRPKPRGLRDSVRMSAEARARTCYDHLAGHLGVAVSDALVARGLVADDDGLAVTEAGKRWLAGAALRIEIPERQRSGRPIVRGCLDWTERRVHLGGVLGAELCRTAVEQRWVERVSGGRALRVTTQGAEAFHTLFGIAPDESGA
jgi:DNA-binding transcriptional ArsR family regulator